MHTLVEWTRANLGCGHQIGRIRKEDLKVPERCQTKDWQQETIATTIICQCLARKENTT